jgi:hypothetical protein
MAAAIATGMDWRELEALIREERRAGNPVAGAIHSLQLDQNKITLLLSNLLDGEEVRPAVAAAAASNHCYCGPFGKQGTEAGHGVSFFTHSTCSLCSSCCVLEFVCIWLAVLGTAGSVMFCVVVL